MTRPTAPDRAEERAALADARRLLAAVHPGIWKRAHDGEGEFVEAQGPFGELLPVARLHPGATAEEIELVVEAPRLLRVMLGMLDRAIETIRPRKDNPPAGEPHTDPKNYAAEAAMKCQEPAFMVFLEERHGLERPPTAEKAAQKLRSLLGVSSRKNLNIDAQAAERWKALRGEFEAWKRVG